MRYFKKGVSHFLSKKIKRYEDRQDLLGHKSGRITTHYSAAELQNLLRQPIKRGSSEWSGFGSVETIRIDSKKIKKVDLDEK